MRKPAFGVSALLIALTLGACSMAPTYERPAAPVADSWSGAAAQRQGAAIDTLDWKSFIVDAELRRLVGVALDNNRPSWISRRPARSTASSAPTGFRA